MTGRFKAKRGGFKAGNYNKKRSSPDDDDTAPPASKKAKGSEEPLVPKLQTDDEGNSYIALKSNNLRRVTVSDFKGQRLISIREYWKNDADEILPGKKGISLTLDQYNTLVTALPLLESVLSDKGDKVERPSYDGEAPADAAAEEEEAEEGQPAKQDEDDEEE